jgi:hypothetical protein
VGGIGWIVEVGVWGEELVTRSMINDKHIQYLYFTWRNSKYLNLRCATLSVNARIELGIFRLKVRFPVRHDTGCRTGRPSTIAHRTSVSSAFIPSGESPVVCGEDVQPYSSRSSHGFLYLQQHVCVGTVVIYK